MSTWFHMLAADVISDLALGESFKSMEKGVFCAWTQLFKEAPRGMAFAMELQEYSLIWKALNLLAPSSALMGKWQENLRATEAMVDRRLGEVDRPDFIRALAAKDDTDPLTLQEIYSNAQVLVMGGSETTSSTLTACCYLLASSPVWLERVQRELRTNFQHEADITLQGLQTTKTPFLDAAIDESMRIQSPGGSALPRVVPAGGDTIKGQYVPAGVSSTALIRFLLNFEVSLALILLSEFSTDWYRHLAS